jgi:pimeloyl-ACP methyl ester carboxylesterase
MHPPCSYTTFSECGLDKEGVKGWWSDDLVLGSRVIFFIGTAVNPESDEPLFGFKDLFADLIAFPLRPRWHPAYRLHAGFVAYADKAWDMTAEIRDDAKPMIILGHSLGASIAAIYAMRYKISRPNQVTCQLFALPTSLAGKTFRDDFKQAFPDARDWCVGWDPMRLLGSFIGRFILLGLQSPVPIEHYKYHHECQFDIKHPFRSIKIFFENVINDHLVPSIMKYVPNMLPIKEK